MTIKTFIERNPVATYFAIVFAISWGSVLILGTPYGMPTTAEKFDEVAPSVLIPYLLGPIIAGLLLTGLLHGRAGLGELKSRLIRWRVGGRWYGVALLTTPLLVTATLLALSRTSSDFLPDIVNTDDRASLILTGLMFGFVFGGLAEETGWTGFAVPRLRARHDILTTGLIVGFLWGLWHILPGYWGSGDPSGALSLRLFLPPCLFFMGILPAYRVLMVWVHDRTKSLFVVMLMHGSFTASTLFILAPAARGVPLFGYYIILTVATWAIVAAVGVANGWQLSRHPVDTNRMETQHVNI